MALGGCSMLLVGFWLTVEVFIAFFRSYFELGLPQGRYARLLSRYHGLIEVVISKNLFRASLEPLAILKFCSNTLPFLSWITKNKLKCLKLVIILESRNGFSLEVHSLAGSYPAVVMIVRAGKILEQNRFLSG